MLIMAIIGNFTVAWVAFSLIKDSIIAGRTKEKLEVYAIVWCIRTGIIKGEKLYWIENFPFFNKRLWKICMNIVCFFDKKLKKTIKHIEKEAYVTEVFYNAIKQGTKIRVSTLN